tara:strand:+ start:397 stop:750 length:354 start_codon:yes stop_codon:yes gene_type:complete
MLDSQPIIPKPTTPAKLAAWLEVSPRWVADKVREIGCYCKIGAKVVMQEHHVKKFMEATECQSQYSNATRSGTTEGQLPEGDYAALREHPTRESHKGSRQKRKLKAGHAISTARVPK